MGTAAPLAAQAVVQPLPPPAAAELSEAMRRLAENPESLPALVAAGRAAVELDDIDAATGFFARARAIAPGDGRVLAGMGLVALRRGEAVSAVRLFDEAEAAGEPMAPLGAERGLAHDLIGDTARAQRHYRQALAAQEDPETRRRLAISQAIAGDHPGSETTLLPLLQRSDRAAFRARAFALAILGREEEAVAIAEAMLPERLSVRLIPYFRHMPRLTRAQQAAAANLGRFPAMAQIGEAGEAGEAGAELAALDSPPAAAPALLPAQADARLIPGGAALGPAVAEPPQEGVAALEGETLPGFTLVSAQPEAGAERGAELPAIAAPAAPAAPAPAAPAAEAEAEIDLAEAFADFARAAPPPVVAPAGAVDITSFEPPRERPTPPPPPPPPPPPAHPSRHWVQVGTGRDLAAFRFDWRRLQREGGELLRARNPYHARWGQTRRLLTGPFDSVAEAQAFVTRLEAAGIDAFRFTSDTGEEVARLP